MSALYRYRWVVLALVAVGVVAGAVLSERAGRPGARGRANTEGDAVAKGQLGPTPGPDAEGYVAEKREYLERVARREPGRRASGLVSFARFLTGPELVSLTGGDVDLVFTRFPGDEPGALGVRGDPNATLDARADEVAARLEAEAVRLEQAAASASGAERRELARQAREHRAQADGIRSACACVYGALVGPVVLGQLAELQRNPAVRLVDVTRPPLADLRGWELRPLIPPG